MARMTKQEYHDLLNSLPKEALIILIEKEMFRPGEATILGAHWNYLAHTAAAIREKSIELGRGHHYHDPEYQEHLRLWKQADRIDRQADKIFAEMEKAYGKQ